jgi:hypothetical protein
MLTSIPASDRAAAGNLWLESIGMTEHNRFAGLHTSPTYFIDSRQSRGTTMTTNAVRELPDQVLFHVEVMRQEIKTIKTHPSRKSPLPSKKWRKRSTFCLKRQARLQKKWPPKRVRSSAASQSPRHLIVSHAELRFSASSPLRLYSCGI